MPKVELESLDILLLEGIVWIAATKINVSLYDFAFETFFACRHPYQCLDTVFLVVDVAQTASGEWIVIECNDGQEGGYAAVAPIALWQHIVDIEKRRL